MTLRVLVWRIEICVATLCLEGRVVNRGGFNQTWFALDSYIKYVSARKWIKKDNGTSISSVASIRHISNVNVTTIKGTWNVVHCKQCTITKKQLSKQLHNNRTIDSLLLNGREQQLRQDVREEARVRKWVPVATGYQKRGSGSFSCCQRCARRRGHGRTSDRTGRHWHWFTVFSSEYCQIV